jgi:predicted hotdog family 3-hydroxylacyl-ACP dehydratase
MSEFPTIVQLIPHREPMILLDEMLDWSPGRSMCCVTVCEDARFVTEGRLETPLLIEHMAQAVAVCLGYEAFRGGHGIRVGMIVGCRTFESFTAAAFVGEKLIVSAAQRGANASVSGFECKVERDDACIARAYLTLYYGSTINALRA